MALSVSKYTVMETVMLIEYGYQVEIGFIYYAANASTGIGTDLKTTSRSNYETIVPYRYICI
jgi:hypothetical protein